MKTITITQKDIEKAKINNTDSGYIIDELAYAAGQWTQNDLDENNWEYEPSEPYEYDFETDLFEHTKTEKELYAVAKTLGISLNANLTNLAKKRKLQCGAFMALKTPDAWKELLEAYTEALKQDGVESISADYSKELQDAKDSFHDDQYKEWLYGDRDYAGVIKEIAKYFTDERDGSYDEKAHSYTFALNDADIDDIKSSWYVDEKYTITDKDIKDELLDSIIASGNNRKAKERAEAEKRKAERERLAAYKAEQVTKAEAERKAKLLSMTIK